jgi:RHS repeat-associated protein
VFLFIGFSNCDIEICGGNSDVWDNQDPSRRAGQPCATQCPNLDNPNPRFPNAWNQVTSNGGDGVTQLSLLYQIYSPNTGPLVGPHVAVFDGALGQQTLDRWDPYSGYYTTNNNCAWDGGDSDDPECNYDRVGAALAYNGSQLCSTATYGYGYPALFLDEAGKKIQLWADGYGRTIETDEPDSNNNLTLQTCYTYDKLNNKTQVVQGSQTRTYAYDALSRNTQEILPESGTTNYYYTQSNGTSLCSGDSNLVCRKSDARSITTTYAYDGLNRLTGKSYSDSTQAVSFSYDQTSYNGLTITNGKGRRTGISNGSDQTAWSYDAAGHVLKETRTIAGITKSTSYTYTLAGSVATITYPSGSTITYSYDNVGHQTSAVDSGHNINYATSATYASSGKLASAVHGLVSGGFAGITRTYTYNGRMQPSTMVTSSSNGTVQNLTYSYDLGSGVNNGSVAKITNNLVTGRTQTFTYDKMNRVASGLTQASSGTGCWGETFTIDRYGNLSGVSVTQCSATPLSLSFNGNNQITNTNFTYDSAGNLTHDGSQAYTWDAENRLGTVAGVTYTYDADGWRRKSSNGTLFWNDIGCGNPVLVETDLNGNTPQEFVYLEKRRIARRDSAGTVYYYFDDHLGSTRVMTNATGSSQWESDYDPYGREFSITSTVDNRYKFSGKRRDTSTGTAETGFDYSLYRMYYPAEGRWTAADPVKGKPGDPQREDLYAYVRNNPTNLIDPFGDLIGNPLGCTPSTISVYGGPVFTYNNLVDGFDFSSGWIPLVAPMCVDGAWHGDFIPLSKVPTVDTDCTKATPLPSNSPKCDNYGSETYAGASEKCFCKCAGDSAWAQKVRGCLLCGFENGWGKWARHVICYNAAGWLGAPGSTLVLCEGKCFVGH